MRIQWLTDAPRRLVENKSCHSCSAFMKKCTNNSYRYFILLRVCIYLERERYYRYTVHFLLCCTEPIISLETKQLWIRADASWRVQHSFKQLFLDKRSRVWNAFEEKVWQNKNVSKPNQRRPSPINMSFRPARPHVDFLNSFEFFSWTVSPAFPSTTAWRKNRGDWVESLP